MYAREIKLPECFINSNQVVNQGGGEMNKEITNRKGNSAINQCSNMRERNGRERERLRESEVMDFWLDDQPKLGLN